MGKKSFYAVYGKRFLDILCSLLALILLALPLLLVAFLVRCDVGSPVLFRQNRVGRGDKVFALLKFRTMNNDRDKSGVYLPDDKRLTRLGSFLRRSSIDELPSLLNILKGDMSIIGPRPLPVRYLERYTKEQRRRHEVRPGLSNPSTVNGRNMQSWEQQLSGDVWYVDHVSLKTDIKSIFDTVKVVLSHEGAVSDDGGAREEFIGTADVKNLQTDAEGNYMNIKRKQ